MVDTKKWNQILNDLQIPEGRVDCVIDTDAKNEVDDQFAIAWALKSTERLNVEAIYAAPFCHDCLSKINAPGMAGMVVDAIIGGTVPPKTGMEQSYDEIIKVLDLMKLDSRPPVFKGAEDYIESTQNPVRSEAVDDLINRAMNHKGKLYVIAIGAITNIASAIMLEPNIKEKIVVIWLSGQPLHFGHGIEFNLIQDMEASKHMFDCGVPLILIPCMAVASNLTISEDEINNKLIGKSAIADYLGKIVLDEFKDELIPVKPALFRNTYLKGLEDNTEEVLGKFPTEKVLWSRIVWDIAAVAWLVNPNWMLSSIVPSPQLEDDFSWNTEDQERHPIRICNFALRDEIYGDLFGKLAD